MQRSASLYIPYFEDEEEFNKNEFDDHESLNCLLDDITDDGGIQKTVIRRGCGPQPKIGSTVTIHYIASLNQDDEEPFESTLTSSPVNLTIGSSSLFWDIALSTMQLDEVSKFVVSSNYTYGDKGLSDIVPPGAKVIYEVELLDIIENNDNNQRIRSDSVEDKMMTVQQLKQQGNDEFHNDNFKPAAKLYSKGLKILDSIKKFDCSDMERIIVTDLTVILFLNRAMCYSKMELWYKVIADTTEVLHYFNDSVKALQLRGNAFQQLGDEKLGTKDLNLAMFLLKK